jgi:hypothetical protein
LFLFETKSVTYNYYYASTLGNDAGDDFGKFHQGGWESMSWVLDDELGMDLSDEYGMRGSPSFSCLLQ